MSSSRSVIQSFRVGVARKVVAFLNYSEIRHDLHEFLSVMSVAVMTSVFPITLQLTSIRISLTLTLLPSHISGRTMLLVANRFANGAFTEPRVRLEFYRWMTCEDCLGISVRFL